MKLRWAFGLVVGLVVFLAGAGAAAAQSEDGAADTVSGGTGQAVAPVDVESAPRPRSRATRTTGPIEVDGRIDEDAWTEAEEITGFVQAQPRTGYPATEKTVVRILYDDENLYIGAVCHDSRPDELTVHSLRRGFESHDSDVFGITIDPFLDRRNAFMFLINPEGAIRDGQVYDNSRNYNLSWEGVIHVQTSRHDEGWSAEIAIPLTTLRFEPGAGEQEWGMNFLRRIRRKAEDAYWAPLDRRERIHKMSRAGTVAGFRDLQSGRNVTVKPYGLVSRSEASAPSRRTLTGDAGFDAKWGITPRLTLDATVNTDFSQVEVDQERVNLTRFSLFFPERRDFFLENSGTFDFGDVTERNYRMGSSLRDFTLFHSRRIGLDEDGRPIPIIGGGRLTGRLGSSEIGLLSMQTDATDARPAENFSVVRGRRNFLGSSDIGAIFISRQATGGDRSYNRAYGTDANVLLFDNLIVNSYYARTDDSEIAGDEWAGRISAAWRDSFWNASGFVKRVGDAFVPDVGFVRRRGVRHAYGTVGIHPRPDGWNLQEVNPFTEMHYFTDLEGLLRTRELTAGVTAEFLDASQAAFEVDRRFERLDDPFPVAGFDAVVPAGDHRFTDTRLSYVSNRGKPLSAEVDLAHGGYFNGEKTSVGLTAIWRADARFGVDLFGEHNRIRLPGRDAFSADVFGFRGRYYHSTELFTTAFVQYNAAAEELVTNLRVNLIHAPLSDVFLVYRERRAVRGEGVVDREIALKVTRLFAF